jgi:hypothetical protein
LIYFLLLEALFVVVGKGSQEDASFVVVVEDCKPFEVSFVVAEEDSIVVGI